MTIPRINPVGWGVGDKLTSAQANGMDINATYAVDNRSYSADLAALAAVAAPADGDIRHVLGFGWYFFKTTATTGLSPFRVAAADLTPGGWLSSTAHETTVTKYFPGSNLVPAFDTPITPSLASLWSPYFTQHYIFGGATYSFTASTDATDAYAFRMPLNEHLIDGATIASAVLTYTPPGSSAPAVMPQFTIARAPLSGLTPTSVHLRAAGFMIDTGSYAAGVSKDVTFTADQNNVIDLSAYTYDIILFDEHGASGSAGNMFQRVSLTMTGVPDARR